MLDRLVDCLEVKELLDGGLLEEELLVEHAAEADHREAAVLHLHEFAARERSGVLAEAANTTTSLSGGRTERHSLELP